VSSGQSYACLIHIYAAHRYHKTTGYWDLGAVLITQWLERHQCGKHCEALDIGGQGRARRRGSKKKGEQEEGRARKRLEKRMSIWSS
jgi:hypothetical protein